MNVGKISSFNVNKKLPFGAEDTKVKEEASKAVVDEDDEDDEEESFFERNKGILGTIGALALIGVVGVVAHKQLKAKSSLKKGSKAENPPKSHDVPHNMDKFDEKFDVWDYTYGLRSLKRDEDVATSLREMLPLHDAKTQIEIIEKLRYATSDSGFPLINSKSWEPVLDTLISIKPEKGDRALSRSVQDTFENVLGGLSSHEVLNSEIIDKIIAKMPNMSNELKLLTAYDLQKSHYTGSLKTVEPIINLEQVRKLMENVENLDSSNVNFSWIVTSDLVKPKVVKYNLVDRYFKNAPINADYTDYLAKIMQGNMLEPTAKLRIIHDLTEYASSAGSKLWFADVDKKDVKNVYRTLMKALADCDYDGSLTPDWSIAHRDSHIKFKVAEKLVSKYRLEFSPYSDDATEYMRCLDNFIESAKNARMSGFVNSTDFSSSVELERLMIERIRIQQKSFDAKHACLCTYEEADKFVEETNDLYLRLKREASYWQDNVKQSFPEEYDVIIQMIMGKLERMGASDFDASKHNSIKDKMNNFKQRHFDYNWWDHLGGGRRGGSSSGRTGSSSGGRSYSSDDKNRYHKYSWNTGSAGSLVRTEETKAKNLLLKYLREDENLKDLAQRLETEELTEKLLKAIKRKLSIKYHPDKVAKESPEIQQQYTQIFQQLSNALDILGKAL